MFNKVANYSYIVYIKHYFQYKIIYANTTEHESLVKLLAMKLIMHKTAKIA